MPIRRSARKPWERGHPALDGGQDALSPNVSLARQRSGAGCENSQGRALAALCGALVLAVSCEAPAPSEEQFRAWVEERYAQPFRNGQTDRWVEAFASDAAGMHHTLPALEGRDAIRDFGRLVHGTFVIDRFELTVNEVQVKDAWALTRGSFVSRFVPREAAVAQQPGAEAAPTAGKFVLIWERQDDGEWRIILDMGNLDSP